MKKLFGKDKDGDGVKDGLFGGNLFKGHVFGKDKDGDGKKDGLFGGAVTSLFKGKTNELLETKGAGEITKVNDFLKDNPLELNANWGTVKTESAIAPSTILMIVGGIALIFFLRKKK